MLTRVVFPIKNNQLKLLSITHRNFCYEGRMVTDDDLVKKHDDWVVEETSFCFGRVAYPNFKATDDLARRSLHNMNSQFKVLHTRMRDGTVIPYSSVWIMSTSDHPVPVEGFTEWALTKYTWDETYDEAYEPIDSYQARKLKEHEERVGSSKK